MKIGNRRKCIIYIFALMFGALMAGVGVGAGVMSARAADKDDAGKKAKQPPIHILFIGNSYTAGIRKMFDQLIAHEKLNVRNEYITPGGKTLSYHAGDQKVIDRIKSRKWDFVVLQEQSQTPAYKGHRERFYAGATKLDKLIRAQGGTTVFFMTWGRRDGDKKNAKVAPDYITMQKLLTEGYTTIGKKLKARVAPVGLVWREVRKQDDTLGKALYRKDGSHPSGQGAYLSCVTFYCTLFDKTPKTLSFRGPMTEAQIKTIKQAMMTVMKKKKPSPAKAK